MNKNNLMQTTVKGVAVLALALAGSAYAQKEQWLEYHMDREGRGYHMLELTTNPPPNVALPKFKAKPYFVRWLTPMDPSGGRWVCFDRTRKSGPYDRLYVDTKGDGRLDDKPALSATRTDQYSAYFDPAKLTFKGEDGPITYHLLFRFMQYDSKQVRALVSSAGYYAGKVDLGGKKKYIELLDNNVNGAFNDQGGRPGDADCVVVEKDMAGQRYLGKLLEVDKQFFRIEVARDGAFVKLQKAEDVALGQVRVPEAISELSLYGANGHFVRKPDKGGFSLPVGTYHVNQWTINRKDSKGASWQLMGYGFDAKKEATLEVAGAQPVSFEIGEPIHLRFDATNISKSSYTFNLGFYGKYDETIQILKGGQRPTGPKLALVSADGAYRQTNTFEFG